ncbi:soluble scavenger receptor cysteine-rich domain-containing protein SSC5D-like [Platysternon megacephalum]|uniref:Soluble scavenger receptor cysteine-rich domain-containing protein SSC5D-like n=1 Tax=Platysternon megacephalum TaxID=55544 RepID=A0A4D9DSN7_9SAUR|nr:soluble scavenger receptor cysteine-rich domain-containing protein SSC5D-like [Platysternon megacephalum]
MTVDCALLTPSGEDAAELFPSQSVPPTTPMLLSLCFLLPGPAMSLAIWATRCTLVLLLLVSAPVITFVMEKRGLPQPAEVETRGGSASILQEEAKGDPH